MRVHFLKWVGVANWGGIEFVKEEIIRPDGKWATRKVKMAWSEAEERKGYNEIRPGDRIIAITEDAIRAWKNSRG
jgi:hypothetical protein